MRVQDARCQFAEQLKEPQLREVTSTQVFDQVDDSRSETAVAIAILVPDCNTFGFLQDPAGAARALRGLVFQNQFRC